MSTPNSSNENHAVFIWNWKLSGSFLLFYTESKKDPSYPFSKKGPSYPFSKVLSVYL